MTLFLLILALVQISVFAHAEPAVPSESKWLLGISEELPRLGVSFRGQNQGEESTYEPMSTAEFAFKAGYGPYRSRVATSVAKNKGKHLDLLAGYNWKAWGFDVFYRTYQGFNAVNSSGGSVGRPDVRSEFYGGAVYRSLNPEIYPLEEISNLSWHGDNRGGSFLAVGNVSHLEIKGDQPLLNSTGFQTAEMFAVTAGPGAGGYLTREHFLINGNISFGLGPQRQKVGYAPASGGPHNDTRVGLVYQWTTNGAFAYRWSQLIAGANLKMTLVKAYLGETQLKTTGFSAEVFLAFRF